MTFHVGGKVICVDAEFQAPWYIQSIKHLPASKGIYTVRAIGIWHFSVGPLPSLWLEEIINPIVRWSCGDISEVGFVARRFRSIVSRQTDISIFRAMLNPSKQGADA